MSRLGTAALLSALIPGLGHVRLGARRRGVLIATPFFGILAIGAGMAIANPHGAIDSLLSQGRPRPRAGAGDRHGRLSPRRGP